MFLEDARRVMLTFGQAQDHARAAAAGYHGTLRIALSGDIGRTRLAALLALCRQEAPEVSVRIFEVPLAQLLHGLSTDLFDAGLTMDGEVDGGVIAAPVWEDPLVVALPARHPLLAFKEVPLEELLSYPLVLCGPQVCEGRHRQRERLFRSIEARPMVAEYVSTHSLMLALVAAGYGVGFSSAAHLDGCQQADLVARPLADQTASLTTYLLRPEGGLIAVGTSITRRPPPRSVRAAFPHTAPTSGA